MSPTTLDYASALGRKLPKDNSVLFDAVLKCLFEGHILVHCLYVKVHELCTS